MNTLRRTVPLLALVALAASGCMLTSGQFVATVELPDPLNVSSAITLTGADVDLNTISEYNDHKDELKRVEDLALVGYFTNNTATAAQIDVWIVPSGALNLTPQQLQANGTRLWGPLAVAAHSTEKVDWDGSSALFVGRQALIDEVKGDGHFALYVVANGAFNVTLMKGSLIVVVGAAI
jgi:hypothetical protein